MRALVFGITGQDGSYTAEMLLNKGYRVFGFVRKTSTGNLKNIEGILDKVTLLRGDVTDYLSVQKAIEEAVPDEIYNQADLDHVSWSWANSDYAYRVTGLAPANIFETCRGSKVKILQPISSNIFTAPSPYSCAKAFTLRVADMYRELGSHIVTPILFNHESVRRTDDYVTRKITKAVGMIKNEKQSVLELGDLSAQIDWGWSPEFVEIEHNLLNSEPGTTEVGTGELHSVQEFVEEAFQVAGLDWEKYVKQNIKLVRPTQTKGRASEGIKTKVKFKEVVKNMVEHDIQNSR